MLRIWIVVIQVSKLPNWSMHNMSFHMLNIKMFLAVADGNIAVNRATDHLSVFFFV